MQHKATSGTYNVLAGLAVKQFAQLKIQKPKIAKKNRIRIQIIQILKISELLKTNFTVLQ